MATKQNKKKMEMKLLIGLIVRFCSHFSFSRARSPLPFPRFRGDFRRRRKGERQKSNRLSRQTTTLHVQYAFWYISLPSLHDYDGKMPPFTFYGGRKQATAKFSFSL